MSNRGFILEEDQTVHDYMSGITVSDLKNAARPVGVWYGLPDQELRDISYPFIGIDLVDVAPALYRRHNGFYSELGTVENESPPVGTSYFVRPMPEPFDLTYQIATYSRNPMHDRTLMAKLLAKFPGNAAIMPVPVYPAGQVTDQQGNCRPAFLDEFTKADTIVDNKKMFRNVFTIRVPAELDPATVQAAKAVAIVRINVAPTQYVPYGLDKPTYN